MEKNKNNQKSMNCNKETKNKRILSLFSPKHSILESSSGDDDDIFGGYESKTPVESDNEDCIINNNQNNNNDNQNNNNDCINQNIIISNDDQEKNKQQQNYFDTRWDFYQKAIIDLASTDPDFKTRNISILNKKNVMQLIDGKESKNSKKRKNIPKSNDKVRSKKRKKNCGNRSCCACSVTETVQWRRGDEENTWMCNACNLLMRKSKISGATFNERLQRRLARMAKKEKNNK